MPLLSRLLEDNSNTMHMLYDHEQDAQAVAPHIQKFTPYTDAGEYLKQRSVQDCKLGHGHVVALSITLKKRFGLIIVMCLGARSVEKPDGTKTLPNPCDLNKLVLKELDEADAQSLADILVKARVNALVQKVESSLKDTHDQLKFSAYGAAHMFFTLDTYDQETALPRIHALLTRMKGCRLEGDKLIARLRTVTLNYGLVDRLHERWAEDVEVDEFLLLKLDPIYEEADKYVIEDLERIPI